VTEPAAAPGGDPLPAAFRGMGRRFPEVMKAYGQLGRATAEAGPLDARVRELVKLGIAFGARLEGAAHAHVRKAREAGATPDEIRHVALLCVTTIGWSASVAAMTWVDDVLSREEAPAPPGTGAP